MSLCAYVFMHVVVCVCVRVCVYVCMYVYMYVKVHVFVVGVLKPVLNFLKFVFIALHLAYTFCMPWSRKHNKAH